jgi:peptidyl-prolyl cis-trans isomerase A (cyclophilin A)
MMRLAAALILLPALVQDEPTFVILVKPGEKWVKDEPFEKQAAEHIKYYAKLEEDARVFCGGPFTDDAGGAMIVVRAGGKEEAQKIAEADPCVVSKVLSAEVRPWKKTMHQRALPIADPNHPKMKLEAPKEYKVKFVTTKGDVVIKITRDWAPRGADRFYCLVKAGFFDGCRFFRVLKGFVAQFGINGDPKISEPWRTAGIQDDPVAQSNTRGRLTFATAGPNTRTTQLFINLADNSKLDSMGFAPIGEVVEGMNIVDSFFADYGEGAPRGGGPEQGRIQMQGNAYLEKDFPKLDWIKSATVIE